MSIVTLTLSRIRSDPRNMRALALICAIMTSACGGGGGGDDMGDDTTTGDGPPGGGDGPPGGNPDAAGGTGEPASLTGMTLYHNQVRAAVDPPANPPLPSMQWSQALAAPAQAWADQCIDNDGNGFIDHNPGRSDGHPYYVGENVYASSGNATAQGAVNAWAQEADNYNYENNSCSGVCGHYTQIVWRTSVDLGCGKSNCPGHDYPSAIVCNYGPGGNNGDQPY